ncbi:fasciclin domain-containing protein [Ktedonosporobacter rubrisoli]|uniref:Fasciclin domain-containing protein n=1 Tax=Ktedonosporobacter rubrisoli TaxID=2509675 RepID=A0A4P6JVD9_KTERU|nr:fasciclin domain-containing protein [Ktedonosporobacter rubrisoli]QBD78926.1 fasciclin domain-containing protein [Ktedonosporobacter rubrisoli]
MSNIEQILQARTAPFTLINLHTAITTCGQEYLLQGGHPLTLLAPYDRAFEKLRAQEDLPLFGNVTMLSRLVQYHVIPLKLTLDDMRKAATPAEDGGKEDGKNTLLLPTVSGQTLTIELSTAPHIGDAHIIEADIEAENGIIHIIDTILWPPGLSKEIPLGAQSPGRPAHD